MSSFNNNPSSSSPSNFDTLLLQNLMGRLQLRPPYLNTNSYLGDSLHDFILAADDEETPLIPENDASDRSSYLAREESKLEREIIRIINGGDVQTLKPNSGQSVVIGEHHMCVGFHDEPDSDYRVWEWHGHIMVYDEENGYCPEYVYGNHFERVSPEAKGGGRGGRKEEKSGEGSGLKDIISGLGTNGGQRVVHRNTLKN
ncbi:hypothetical protein QJS10_CPA07g00253 [Acorus calamus]|uniref:Uncharacterized protein n=1 Tax=Acorus calamus TaxID=4465 RepID=A0AAV9EG29_ACOCL|nr:hypothetical protein QJS10_CPA07g00253 [Acorus calamus]